MQKIELYKRRTWSQSLLTGIDFYQQHIKIIYGNVFKIGLPAALLGIIILSIGRSKEVSSTTHQLIFAVVMQAIYALIFVIISYLIQFYEEGQIKSPRKFQLMENFLPYSGKIVAIQLVVYLPFYLGSYALGKMIVIENLYAVFLLIGMLIFLSPLSLLVPYPVFFEESNVFDSLSKGIRMGFKTWGTTFMIGFVVFVIMMMMYFFFALISIFFSLFGGGVTSPLYIFFLILGIFLILPIPVICFAFHYFSIREANEGVSLKAKIDDFENL